MILSNKTLNFSSIENINNHAKNYKRNYKVCQKLFEKSTEEASILFRNELIPLLIENRELSNPLREEVLNWFFSLPLETRFKVITVENSWVINIIHQMYVHYKQDNSTSFQFLQEEKSSEKEADSPLNTQIYFQNVVSPNVSNTYENNINNLTINNKYNTNFITNSVEEQNLKTHFNIKIIKREKHDYYLTTMFLKETRFFSVHSNIDCLSLSPKVLDDKELFLHYFKNFSKDKCFSKLIEVIQDTKTKLYSFGFPKWIEKDFHQITAFIIAFFEHAILIKFILNYNNKNKDKIITSLHDEMGFNECFKLRKEIIFFLNENYPNNKITQTNLVPNVSNSNDINNKISNNNSGNYTNSVKLNFQSEFGSGAIGNFANNNNEFVNKFIINLNVKNIYKNIYTNKLLLDSINSRNQYNEKYTEFYQRKLNSQEPLFEGINEEDTEKKILRLYSNEDIIVFVDNLIFTKIDSIWRLDFFIGIELLQAIHNLYTDKNALDLIKEFDEGKESTSFGKNKKNKNKKIKAPELTIRDIEKINFNYYKPYMNKENLVTQNKQQSYQNENQSLEINGKNINNNFNKDYGTITSQKNNISLNNNSNVSLSSEKNDNQLKDSKIIDNVNINYKRIENLTTAKKQNLNREKDKENDKHKDKDFSFEKNIIQNEEKIETSSDYKIIEGKYQYNSELTKLENEQTEIKINSNYNFILCKEIIIEIIDNAPIQIENNLKNKIKTLDDVLDNIQAIEKKSKEINKLLTNSLYNNHGENPNNCDLNSNSDLNKITNNIKKNQNNNLTIECAYDIELGIKTNSRSNNNLNQDNNLKNNFIIENHQISIENSRPSYVKNTNLNDSLNEENNNSFKKLGFEKNKKQNKDEFNKNTNNAKDDYFDEKEASDKDTDNYEIEINNNHEKNNSSDSSINIKKRRKNNNNSRNFELNTNVDSDSEYEDFIKVNKNNRDKDSMPAPANTNQDDDSENNNLNAKDKRKKNKKKVQKFYQINIEKMNKKKNIVNTKAENKGTSYTINKSTQTQNTKEINNVNVNLKINNQNLISGNSNSSINNQNINNNYKKYDKKNGNPKFNNNNSNNNHANTTNVNINNNLSIHSIKTNTNSTGFGKGNSTNKEFSKYDYPKNNKKNSFHKGNPPINSSNNGNSESPSEEKHYGNPTLNLSSIINSKNIKEFNYSYSFNNRNGNCNSNNYNINFNYDLSYDNLYGNSFANNFSNPFSGNYNNNRKKSLNWSEKNLHVNTNNPTFYDINNSKNLISNNNYLSSNSFNNSFIKPNNNNEFLAYVFKLHYDIVNYHNNVVEIVKCLKDIKINVINYLEKLLKEFIDYELSLDVFGSFASDLSIESSDIDLKVNILNQDSISINYEELIFNLVKKFNNLNIFEFVMPIHTASVPIIKLIIDPTKIIEDDNLLIYEEFKHSYAYEVFKFNKEELNNFRIDLTFLDLIKKQQTNSLGSIDFAKNHVILYTEIKPILYVLKRLLQERNLNSAFNGGLSSYCIFLLILAFLKYQKATNYNLNSNQNSSSNSNNLGKLLIDILEYYGRMFNFHVLMIDVNQSNPYIYDTQYYEKCPVILDPLNYHNVSKSSFRIDEVKECFSKAYEYLIQIKYKYDRKDSDNNRNIIYDLLLNKNI